MLILHIDPLGQENTFEPDAGMYTLTYDEIDWLTEEAARHDLHFTALYNGWFPQWALEQGDLDQFRDVLAAGHEIGSHAHRITYDPAQDLWLNRVDEINRYGQPNYDAALAQQCWNDAYEHVAAVLDATGTTGQNQTMCAVPFKCSDEGQLMHEFGFAIAAGNRSEKGPNYLGHIVWNPWRPAASDEPGHELAEDPTANYIALDHYAQIGKSEAHGMDVTTPQLQRRFLMLYAEWLSRERTGAEDRVWTFGFVYHPNQGDSYNAALAEFLDWLDTYFIGQQSPYGHTIARYATATEVGQEFAAWEAAHPGASSFNYLRDDPYPYTYAVVPTMLENAAYEAHVDLGGGVKCFRFSKDGQPLYVLWSDQGEQTVDLSGELPGQVQVTDSTGGERVADAAALPLTADPLFVEPTGDLSDPCSNPNPHRAIASALQDWHDWMDDGSFEEDRFEVVAYDHPTLPIARARAERTPEAARTGSYGYAITAGPQEGILFGIKTYVERGEPIRFSFWARSPGGEITLQPKVYWVEGYEPNPDLVYTPETAFTVGPEWTQVSFTTSNTKGVRYALLTLELGPDTLLHIDDVAVELPIWRMAEYDDPSRTVGGIPVPSEPAAPVHIAVLIHVEDPERLQTNEAFFQQKTAVFRELARTLHDHGGFLTIQPEEDWVLGANRFDPGLLQELAEQYGVIYSTHTHGPHCQDDEGRLRSLSDCNANPGWDQEPNDYESPWVAEYVRNLHDTIVAAAGVPVTDHNGNWEFDQASALAEIPMLTWSAYKNHHDQSTYDLLINNPWRPTECDADQEIAKFVTHDPDTQIVYIPGWGQAITRHQERLLERMRPLVSQFIYYADPDRVNTFYIVTHIDQFQSRSAEDSENYIVYDPATGTLTYSDEFEQDITYWDQMLSELIDPLVAEGYLQWTSLPGMGELYLEWEANCGQR
jgi:hypothetical protein